MRGIRKDCQVNIHTHTHTLGSREPRIRKPQQCSSCLSSTKPVNEHLHVSGDNLSFPSPRSATERCFISHQTRKSQSAQPLKHRASLMAQMVKSLPAMRRPGFDPWAGKIPGGGDGNPLQYSRLENPMDRGAWQAAFRRIMLSRTWLVTTHSTALMNDPEVLQTTRKLNGCASSDYQRHNSSHFDSSSVTALCPYLYFPIIMIAAATKWSESEVAQSCPTLCDPMDGSPPGFTVHGILQARVLERAAIPFSRESSQPRDRTQVSCIAGRRFTVSSEPPLSNIYISFI